MLTHREKTVGTQQDSHLQVKKKVLEEAKPSYTLILDFWSPEL